MIEKTTLIKTPKEVIYTDEKSKTVAIAGNPNVGKSTVFNALTGLHQHTGNWPGKTVSCTKGTYYYENQRFNLVDIPGTYSLLANSLEEEIARDFICFNNPDVVLIVIDATCIERNLNLVFQILEITSKVVVCVNLVDEAKNKKIEINKEELSSQLGNIPIIFTNARKKQGMNELMQKIKSMCNGDINISKISNNYSLKIDNSIRKVSLAIESEFPKLKINSRWLSLRLLENEENFKISLKKYLPKVLKNSKIKKTISSEVKKLKSEKINTKNFRDCIVKSIIEKSENVYNLCVTLKDKNYDKFDRKIDKFLTSRLTGFPTMIIFLFLIFWITISGANYPSEIISKILFSAEGKLFDILLSLKMPMIFCEAMIFGVYKTLAWVVSVMLPPMAIFFPLFTFLEDIGYLPRIAFNLDKIFKKCGSHGKQALTMCMGFGCNACAVVGCRIIDSPRERLISILTNNFVPCNGRFPLLISIISMFFVGGYLKKYGFLISSLILTFIIMFGFIITFLISKFLSKTILKGINSSFILELPPYRKPQVGKILLRSLLDRTVFVLARAVIVAAPAGLLIWIMANVSINNLSLLVYFSNFLNPFAKLIGLDGVILMAFILGFPANEIVFPIIIMSYMSLGSITDMQNLNDLYNLLVLHNWTFVTAICTMIFSLLHFPCATTYLTIKKETKSLKWALLSLLIPTITGIVICFLVSNVLNFIINLR